MGSLMQRGFVFLEKFQEVNVDVRRCVYEQNKATDGNRASNTRWPVSRGWLAGSFSVTGRTWRTGQTCTMVNFSFTPSNSSSNTTSYKHTHFCVMYILHTFIFIRIFALRSKQNSHTAHRDVIVARWCHIGDGTTVFGWQHGFVFNERVLVHKTIDVSSGYVTPNLTQKSEEGICYTASKRFLLNPKLNWGKSS